MRNSFLGILALILITVSCEKPESKLGLELLPDEEYLGCVIDSSTVIMRTSLHDSLRTDRLLTGLLGDFTDIAISDQTLASSYFQLRLSNPDVEFGTNPEIDSLVLSIAYTGNHYGALEEMQFSVFRLQEDLTLDSTYNSYDDADSALVQLNLVNDTFVPNLEDDVVVGGDTLGPHMRLKFAQTMADTLGSELLGADIYDSNEDFLEYFKGLKVSATATAGDGGLLYMNINNSPLTKLTMYYHTEDVDSVSYDFFINSQSQNYTRFEHDYGFPVTDQLNDMDSLGTNFYEEVFIQAGAGLGVDVLLPNLEDFADLDNIIINRAVLELPIVDGSDEPNEPSATIKAVRMVDGEEENIPDAVLSGSGTEYVGGVYDEDEKVYKVTVTRFVQQVLNGQIEEPIFTLIPSLSRTVGNRSIIKVGTIGDSRRAKLIINYTTF